MLKLRYKLELLKREIQIQDRRDAIKDLEYALKKTK